MVDILRGAANVAVGMVEGVVEFIDSRNRIWVQLNQFSYVGGDTVQGVVHMNCIVRFG